jgi:hypothetical protein
MAEAIDGRLWFFPEILNGWSPAKATGGDTSWYAVDFGQRRKIATIDLYFFDDGQLSGVKYSFRLTTTIITDSCWNVFPSSPC